MAENPNPINIEDWGTDDLLRWLLLKGINWTDPSQPTNAIQKVLESNSSDIKTALNSVISTINSTTTPLGIDGIFTGTGEDISQYAAIAIVLITDKNSATDGLSLQWSSDNVNWDHTQVRDITGGQNFTTQAMVEAKYFRIVYTNGGTAQTYFRLQTIFMKRASLGEVQQLRYVLKDTGDAQLVRAVIAGKTPAGPYINLDATNGGNLKISLEELENNISVNDNKQLKVTLHDINGRELEFDSISKYLVALDGEHHKIHEEDHYFYSDCITLGNGATQDYMLTVPNNAIRKHFTFTVKSSFLITVAVFEAGDRTGTTVQTIYNNDRDSVNTTDLVIHKGTSGGTTDGTDIHPDCSGSSTAGGSAGISERSKELLLKTNTKYILRVTSGAANNNISTVLDLYEHTDE